jgi:large subunit ribosomal protein L17
MASSLILHKRINTTVAKAKALRMYVEPLITKAKEDTTHSRRVVFSYLQDKFAVTELFREVSGKIADRPGGYTRVIKLGKRLGDNAEMAMIELVDYNEHMLSEKASKKKKTTRRRGGKKKAADTTVAETTAPKVEEPKAEVKEEVKEEKKEAKAEVKATEKEEVKAEEKKPEAKATDDKKEE